MNARRITSFQFGYVGNKVAGVDRETGEMIADEQKWKALTKNIQQWIIKHEGKHLELDSDDENLVNTHALKEFYDEGGDVEEVVWWMKKTLNEYIEEHWQQLQHLEKVAALLISKQDHMINHILQVDYETRNEQTGLGAGGIEQGQPQTEAPLTTGGIRPASVLSPVDAAIHPEGYVDEPPVNGGLMADVPTGGIKPQPTQLATVYTMGSSTANSGGSGSNSGTAAPSKTSALVNNVKRYWVWIALFILLVVVFNTSPKN